MCVKGCGKDTGSEEEIYHEAACILANSYEWRYMGNYEYFIHYEEDVEGQWKEFRAMIEEGRPIDGKIELLKENFDDDVYIYWLMSDAWEAKFYNCVNVVKADIEQSDIVDKEQVSEMLAEYESFIGKWADYNDTFAGMEASTVSGRYIGKL